VVLKNPTEYEKGKTIVFFVRHGDRGNLDENDLIRPGPGLTEKGFQQAKDVANKFSKIKREIDAIYSSDMKRAVQTAEIMSKKINKKIKIIHDFSEVDRILEKGHKISLKYLRAHLKFKRAIKKLDEILDKEKGKVIIIVAHGRIIKSILGNKLKIGIKKGNAFSYHNCHISKIRFKGKKLNYINYFNSQELIH